VSNRITISKGEPPYGVSLFAVLDYSGEKHKWELGGSKKHSLQLVSVISGSGSLIKREETYNFKKGDYFLLPSGFEEFDLNGNAELIVSHL